MQLADELFETYSKHIMAEHKLCDFLEVIGLQDWNDFSYDYYDSSLELYYVPNDVRLTKEQQKAFEATGFSIVWLNHQDGWETTYCLHRGTEGRRETRVKPVDETRKIVRKFTRDILAILIEREHHAPLPSTNARPTEIKCAACYEEFGSYACLRPAHLVPS